MSEPEVYEIPALVEACHAYVVSHGFWPGTYAQHVARVPEALALVHEEVSEALRDWRKDEQFPSMHYREVDGKPEGFPAELADIVLRVCDLAGALDVDLNQAIREVREWSIANRPHRHGDVR